MAKRRRKLLLGGLLSAVLSGGKLSAFGMYALLVVEMKK
jgi:hypothetical protein